jgi:metallo-beta-lactamase family protein
MDVKIKFLGAAQNVTGSRYLLEVNDKKILVDCGLHQERDLKDRDWLAFPVPPNTIDCVLLTHGHLDHCGLLPKFVRDGFQGKIICTEATAEIAQVVMIDAGTLQEEDARLKRERHEKEDRKPHKEIRPLYGVNDAKKACKHFQTVKLNQQIQLAPGIMAEFRECGHILGSSSIMVTVDHNGETRRILFSGDVGRWDKPILRDPTGFDVCDYLLIESTYGNRLHEKKENVADLLADIINSTCEAGGNIVIPSFAIERSHELLYHLNILLMEKRIPHLVVFLDSPMAQGVTEVFKNHPELLDTETTELLHSGHSPFDFPGLKTTRRAAESKSINHIKGTAIIIAGAGMCTGGRIKHHLVHNICRPECTILFVGFQANGTLGRAIVDGATEARIFGRYFPIKARIAQIHGLSAHADRDELLRWMGFLKQPPKHVFVTHGEPEAAQAFAQTLREKNYPSVSVPGYLEEQLLT